MNEPHGAREEAVAQAIQELSQCVLLRQVSMNAGDSVKVHERYVAQAALRVVRAIDALPGPLQPPHWARLRFEKGR